MGKFYMTLISLCIYFLSLQNGLAQCPQPEQLNIQTTDARSFEDNSGEIVFTFSAEVTFNRDQYRIRLWDHDEQRYVYDDNNPDFLNITTALVSNGKISFASLPKSSYALELHGGDCQYARFEVGGHLGNKSK
ncbi:hypothetical protein [Catalinimonas niigatensis]|uniref:hypothetical protein n=1 Tax=Catalinimonas niigatensis TaxID=1397264 RepID=UPI002665F3F0|nr:hypothetical protein [Catalinimonas niigatensis]WPP49449.1 hypothetical protein PZB72_22520 [Catalinimonas niigatensis]